MEKYFNILYEFDRDQVHKAITTRLTQSGSDYICVSDGVILTTVNRDTTYRDVVNGGMFSICDSSYVPLYLKLIYGIKRNQYCGSQIFKDIVSAKKYRMIFLGTDNRTLSALKFQLKKFNPNVEMMQFVELPYLDVKDFDYVSIAELIEKDRAEIIWVALGAPKQERFMAYLKPHLGHGVMIAVGAAFKFFSGLETKRAPKWMVKSHTEFIHRILKEPKKQLKRCFQIIRYLPNILYKEWKVAKSIQQVSVK